MLFTVIIVVIISAVVNLIIKKYSPEHAMLVAVVSGCVILGFLIAALNNVFDSIFDLFSDSGINNEIFKVVIKALGICYITEFAVDICNDFGQTSLGAKAELAGKISVIILTLPLIKQILSAAVELIK